VSVVLLGVLLVLAIAVQAATVHEDRSPRSVRPPSLDRAWRSRREQSRRRRLPLRPAVDQPPADLRPLVASPRLVAQEAARGIRELEDWLAGRTA
jgi:hypothetical protein